MATTMGVAAAAEVMVATMWIKAVTFWAAMVARVAMGLGNNNGGGGK